MKQTTKSNVGFRDRLDPLNDTVTTKPYGNPSVNLTASALVRTGASTIVGMYVNSTSAGTVKIWDSLTATGTVKFNTITPAVGYHNLGPVSCATGIYVTIGGTIDITFIYNDPTAQS